MIKRLLAILMLKSLPQAKADKTPLPDPPGQTLVVGVSVMNGRSREVRRITLLIPAPPAPADEDDEPRPAPFVGRIDLNSAVVTRENFDYWVFEDARTEVGRKRRLEEILRVKLEAATHKHKLTAQQRSKLRLAGSGDIKRFFDQVESRRVQFELARKTYRTGRAALLELAPLSQIYKQGPFGEDSLFAKTLRKIRDDPERGC